MRFNGQKMKDLRNAHEMSQRELGEKVGVDRVTIIKWENEETSPKIDQLGLIGEALGVPAKYFIENGEDKK